ncbi:unannotated protein [freshwater metagenome]|uniref:Unannotated protein n=1 Tax=freshwater metagenome TaxID=449393 RepID=A0A6J6M3Y8_9ZZZZ|nr:hypothetical protein [Actinomycetota bacterium]
MVRKISMLAIFTTVFVDLVGFGFKLLFRPKHVTTHTGASEGVPSH